MAETQELWFRSKCPVCWKKIGTGAATHDEMFQKLMWHLQSSTSHPMDEEAAAEIIQNNPTTIWEDGEGTFEEDLDKEDDGQREDEQPEPQPRLRSRSRSPRRSDRRDGRRDDRRDDRRDREDRHNGSGKKGHGKQQAVVPYQGKGSGSKGSNLSWRDQQIVAVTRDRVIESVVTEQQEKVFAFAKTFGKCEAVIRTATRVARQAVSAFEDIVCHLTHSSI